jgi:hypothetical protein
MEKFSSMPIPSHPGERAIIFADKGEFIFVLKCYSGIITQTIALINEGGQQSLPAFAYETNQFLII